MPTDPIDGATIGLTPRLRAAYPQLFVRDVTLAAAFYRERLGFRIDYLYGEPPFYGLLSRDGAGLNLRHTDGPVIEPAQRERDRLLSANIPVDGIEVLFGEFLAAGVEFAQRLDRQPWGTLDFILRDPDGNLLCFAEHAVTSR